VTKTCLSPTEAILSWKWSRNFSRWNFRNQFIDSLSTTKLLSKLSGWSLL